MFTFARMKNLATRRTIRHYSGKEVSDELLNRLLSEASRTQTMGNLQLYSVVVTRSKEIKQQLAPAHFNQPMVTQAPVVLTVCADFNRTSTWARCRQAEPGYDNFLSFINAATDALLYTQTLCNLMDEPPAPGKLCPPGNLPRLPGHRHRQVLFRQGALA